MADPNKDIDAAAAAANNAAQKATGSTSGYCSAVAGTYSIERRVLGIVELIIKLVFSGCELLSFPIILSLGRSVK